jgi:serine/threonine protein kinase
MIMSRRIGMTRHLCVIGVLCTTHQWFRNIDRLPRMDAVFQTGDVLRGRYEVQRLLRDAPARKVYLALDRQLDFQVALDVFSSNSVMPGGHTVSAWEARLLGQLGDHPNIATVIDHWEDHETAFMVSRYLSGGSLLDLIMRTQESGEGLPVDRILQLSLEISSGLAHIHGRRFLHRDLQPRNVLLDARGAVHLVDFDTAVSLDSHDVSDLSGRPVTGYTAPELTDGTRPDERADLYSLGATMFAMCEGRPPYAGTGEEILTARRTGPPPSPERDDLPAALRDLIMRLLAPDRGQRPTTAAEVADLLEELRATLAREPAAPRPADSQSLPEPDSAEVQSSARAKAADYAVGDVIDGRFEIIGLLGRGGFSKVYRVRDDVEDEERALKLFDSAAGYAAVRREIGALRKVRHPNVIEVFWAGKTGDGDWYLITEFIDGEPLDEFVTGKRHLRDREAVDVALDVLDALVAIHPDSSRLQELAAKDRENELTEAEFHELMELKDKGLVHRDIKPQNVMLTRTGAKLLDFNIASRVGDSVYTQTGTPPYQPPDPDFTRWDVSTDLFAVGVMLYELLCDSHHPYPNSRPLIAEPVIDPTTIRRDLNPELAEFLIKACAPDRSDRFSTAANMQLALRKIRADL